MIRRPPRSTLFPYPTLSRSRHERRDVARLRFDDRQRGERSGFPFDFAFGELLDIRGIHTRGALEQSRVEIKHVAGIRFASRDRKSTRLNSSHSQISYAVFCL